MRRTPLAPTAMLLLLPLIAAGPATEPAPRPAAGPVMDDPRYAAWAGFKVGSSETYAGDLKMQGRTAHISVTQKLVSVTADAVTLDVSTTVEMGGQPVSLKTQQQTIPAKTDQLASVHQTGTEDVAAMGRSFPCAVKVLTPVNDDPTDSRKTTADLCPNVPGGIVKIDAPQAGKRVTLTLTAYEAK